MLGRCCQWTVVVAWCDRSIAAPVTHPSANVRPLILMHFPVIPTAMRDDECVRRATALFRIAARLEGDGNAALSGNIDLTLRILAGADVPDTYFGVHNRVVSMVPLCDWR